MIEAYSRNINWLTARLLLLLTLGITLLMPLADASDENGSLCVSSKSSTSDMPGTALPQLVENRSLALKKPVTALAWSPDGRLIATSELLDTVVKVWEADTGILLHTIQKTHKGSERLLFTADGRYLITSSVAGFDGVNRTALSVIDVISGVVVRNLDGPHDPTSFARADVPADFVLSPDGKIIYVKFNTSDGLIYYYDTTTWNELGSFPAGAFGMVGGPHADQLTAVEIGPSTNLRPGPLWHGVPTMLADEHTNVVVWSSSAKKFVKKFELPVPISPGSAALDTTKCRLVIGHYFVSGPEVKPLEVVDLNSGVKLASMSANPPIHDLSLSPNGAWLAFAGDDKTAILTDAASLTKTAVIHRFEDYAWRTRFSPDGRRVAVAGDQTVIIYDLR